jgi:glycosyltransferase involved in cell wall biosynthesis
MNIAVDLRSLSSGTISGVENYTLNLLDNLLTEDKLNHYTLFNNALKKSAGPDFHFVNSTLKYSRLPNKLVNLGLKFKLLKLERLAGEFDCLFMPNLNQFNVSPKTKVVLTVHDLSPVVTPEFYDAKRRIWHQFLNYKKAFQRANILLAVSQHTKNDLIRIFGVNPNKIRVIYPGVDHKIFHNEISSDSLRSVRNIYGLPGEFILFLNTIEPRKNLANLIRAFEKLQHSANLVIAGRLGWKYGRDFQLIKKSKKSAKIKYIGYVEEKHKPALIKLAQVLVYPSFYEGFGFQAIEAMATGTAVLASQVTSLPEVAGNSALLIDPYNPDGLAEGLKQILTNQLLRQRLIGKALLRAKDFSWQKTAQATLEALTI